MDRKKLCILIALIIVFCSIMAYVDAVFVADYMMKSLIKLALFVALPFLYSHFDKNLDLKSVLNFSKKGVKTALFLCFGVYFTIIFAYFIFKNVFDFSMITTSLTNNIGVNKHNFIYVSLYISFINSFLEEFFFRGFVFLSLKRVSTRRFAYIFSALVFSLYHIAMMIGWFSIWVFALVLIGLFVGGIIFNYLNEKSENIYTSWLVHMFANFAINTIGFMLFGVI